MEAELQKVEEAQLQFEECMEEESGRSLQVEDSQVIDLAFQSAL
jgi:hypothetical protein